MQLTKGNPFEDNSLFPDQMLLHDPPSPQSPPLSGHKHRLKPQTLDEDQPNHNDSNNLLPQLDSNELRFYHEFKKIYTVAHHLSLEKKRQMGLWQNLTKRIKQLDQKMKETDDRKNTSREQIYQDSKMKRSRRTAEQIEKKYKCQVPYCERLYGSEGSLQQHIKLKHPELYHKSQSQSDYLKVSDSSL